MFYPSSHNIYPLPVYFKGGNIISQVNILFWFDQHNQWFYLIINMSQFAKLISIIVFIIIVYDKNPNQNIAAEHIDMFQCF